MNKEDKKFKKALKDIKLLLESKKNNQILLVEDIDEIFIKHKINSDDLEG